MNHLQDISVELDMLFGASGTKSRKEAERKAWQEYHKQRLIDRLKK